MEKINGVATIKLSNQVRSYSNDKFIIYVYNYKNTNRTKW